VDAAGVLYCAEKVRSFLLPDKYELSSTAKNRGDVMKLLGGGFVTP
jgi:hypothetical protein